MATFVNHVAIAAPRNGTTTHTVDPASVTTTGGTVVTGTLFTPTAGRLLVVLVYGAVTSGSTTGVPANPPSGWTKPVEAVNNGGLYVWHRTAAGADTIPVSHNGSNYPVIYDIYEFASGSTFGSAVGAINVASGGAGPTLSGLSTSTTSWRAGVLGRSDAAGNPITSGFNITWNAGTEIVETAEVRAGTPATDGYQFGVTMLEAATATQAFTATLAVAGGSATSERLVISVNAVAPVTIPSGSGASSTTWSGTAVGSAPAAAQGTAVGTVTWSGTAAGARASAGTATSSTTWSGTAAGPSSALSIADENAQAGRAQSLWYDGVGSEQMPAFARSSYYEPGQTAEFSVNFNSAFTYEIIRLGHYSNGTGGRRVAGPFSGTPASQPAPVAITGGNGAVDCAGWSKNVTWSIPADVTPGWYYLYLTDGSSNFGHALFCVTDKQAKKPVLAITGDATWHAAYNGFGGNNVYGATKGVGDISARAYCSSYDKPVITKDYVPQTHFFNASWASFKYLESLGIEVGYATIEQINNDPTIMDGRDVIIFSGHNEYISQPVMNKTKALLAAGQRFVNWAANDFFWRVKFGSTTSMNTPGRVMWCKKDTMAGPSGSGHAAGTPFTTAADWTGTWQDTRWANREPSVDFFGDRFIANGIRNDSVAVPFAMKTSPLWRSCAGVQTLTSGQTFTFGAGSLGMEWDMPDGSLPQVRLSSTSVNLAGNSADANGENYNGNGTWEHSIAVVRSGAGLVFNFNSDQWGKTLDNMNIRHGNIANVNARQACLNVLTDLGVVSNSAMVTAASLTMPTPVASNTNNAIGTAYGLASVPNAGTGDSSTTWSSTAAGKASNGGTGASSTTWSATAAGTSPVNGTGSGSTTWSSTAAGTTQARGDGTSSTTWSATAAGSAPVVGMASGAGSSSTTWSSTAAGSAPALGSAAGTGSSTTTWAGAAAGASSRAGAASSDTSWSGTASGFAPVVPGMPVGGGAISTTWSSAATGVRFAFGTGLSGTVWTGVAHGPDSGEPLLLTAGPALRNPYSVSKPTILGSPVVSEPIHADDPDASRTYPISRAGGSAFDFTPVVKVRGLDVEIPCTWVSGPAGTRNLRVPLTDATLPIGSMLFLRLAIPGESDLELGWVIIEAAATV